jgi:hypothetical protein
MEPPGRSGTAIGRVRLSAKQNHYSLPEMDPFPAR